MTEDDLAEIERQYEKYTPIFGIGEAEAHVPTLIAEVRRLRDEREALAATIEVGFASGRCPMCEPRFERGGDLYAHDPECPFRNWKKDGIDVAALTANHKAVKAETDAWLRQWEAEHPDLAEKLRRRAAELADR